MISFPRPLLLRYATICLLATLLAHCANPIPPIGGEKDEQPPRVDTTRSTPDLQTNFRPQQIELTFDEWVKLNKPNEQVIISPPVQGFSVRLKGRTVILDLGEKDTLRDNVTYVVQFGEAVQDLTENNSAKDLRFVFSTGDFIDSLRIRGTVADAYTEEPVEGALVMLYANLADTAFRTERPFYFGRTDEKGNYTISNIKAGQYQLTALQDADANYRYSQVNEPIAFLADPITISAHSSKRLDLRLFTEALPVQINDVDSSRFGLLRLGFNTDPKDRIEWESDLPLQPIYDQDSLLLWYQSDNRGELLVAYDTLWQDTLTLRSASRAAAAEQLPPIEVNTEKISNTGLYPKRLLKLEATRPLEGTDTSLWTLKRDTFPERIALQNVVIDSTTSTTVQLAQRWTPNSSYQLEILPTGLTDAWGVASTDTINLTWQVGEEKRFGNINFQFTTADTLAQYYVRLVSGNKPPIATFLLAGDTDYKRNLVGLIPGEYQLEVILDDNRNERWDSGNFSAKRQPERVHIQKLENLRASWDIEVLVELGNLFLND